MQGIIVVNGYYSTEASENQAKRVEQELKKRGLDVRIFRNKSVRAVSDALHYDFAVFFDKDIYLARQLENNGVRVFNKAQAIEDTDDKIKTAIILEKHGLPAPTVIPAPKRYGNGADGEFLFSAGARLGYPLVVKAAEGSLGMDVYLANNYEELKSIDAKISDKSRLYQKYIPSVGGESVRVIVIGGKAVCAMRLKNRLDFRSNAAAGGVAEKEELSPETAALAEKAAEIFDLDYCGADLFGDGKNIIEINSNAYFKTMEKVTGYNVAETYAEYIAKVMGA